MNSKHKGKRGELEVAAILREHGYDARRGQQYSGASGDSYFFSGKFSGVSSNPSIKVIYSVTFFLASPYVKL